MTCPTGVATAIGGDAENVGIEAAAAVGHENVCEGHVPVTVQPLLDVGAGAAVPVPPLATDSGKAGSGEAKIVYGYEPEMRMPPEAVGEGVVWAATGEAKIVYGKDPVIRIPPEAVGDGVI